MQALVHFHAWFRPVTHDRRSFFRLPYTIIIYYYYILLYWHLSYYAAFQKLDTCPRIPRRPSFFDDYHPPDWQFPFPMIQFNKFWKTMISEFFQSNYLDHSPAGVEAIRTAGSTADWRPLCSLIDWVKSSNFISWFLYNRNAPARRLVKRSIRVVKVIIAI